jgi:hypothetical protein
MRKESSAAKLTHDTLQSGNNKECIRRPVEYLGQAGNLSNTLWEEHVNAAVAVLGPVLRL